MTDEAHDATDRRIEALERRLVRLFAEAENPLQERARAFYARFEKEDKAQRKRMEDGEITAHEYRLWRLSKFGRGKEFDALRDEIAEGMTAANQEAADVTAEAMPAVYAENYDQEAEELNQEEKTNIPLLVTAAAVVLLLKKSPALMKQPTLDRKKDLKWNRRQYSAAFTSYILQDKPIFGPNGICVASLTHTVGRNTQTARTNARTFMTHAEASARQAVYNTADKMGIHREKTWYTMDDARVRDAHAAMDGESVPWTEKFIVDGYEMDGPGDQRAPVRLWINCRCRMKSRKIGG